MSEIDVKHVLELRQEYETSREATIKLLLERQKEIAEYLKTIGYKKKPALGQEGAKRCSACGADDHNVRSHRKNNKGKDAESLGSNVRD